jgi:hypothetical protein
MVDEKEIKKFVDSGLLWLVNNLLHVFGWAIVYEIDDDKKYIRMFPARVKFRGFNEEINDEGYIKVSKFMKDNADTLLKETQE